MFRFALPSAGSVVVAQTLDYESLVEAGQTYYVLNISAQVGTLFSQILSSDLCIL